VPTTEKRNPYRELTKNLTEPHPKPKRIPVTKEIETPEVPSVPAVPVEDNVVNVIDSPGDFISSPESETEGVVIDTPKKTRRRRIQQSEETETIPDGDTEENS